jgi:hypothetical protein
MGVRLDETRPVVEQLRERFEAFVPAVDTTANSARRLSLAWGEAQESMGRALTNALQLKPALDGMADAINRWAEGSIRWYDVLDIAFDPDGSYQDRILERSEAVRGLTGRERELAEQLLETSKEARRFAEMPVGEWPADAAVINEIYHVRELQKELAALQKARRDAAPPTSDDGGMVFEGAEIKGDREKFAKQQADALKKMWADEVRAADLAAKRREARERERLEYILEGLRIEADARTEAVEEFERQESAMWDAATDDMRAAADEYAYGQQRMTQIAEEESDKRRAFAQMEFEAFLSMGVNAYYGLANAIVSSMGKGSDAVVKAIGTQLMAMGTSWLIAAPVDFFLKSPLVAGIEAGAGALALATGAAMGGTAAWGGGGGGSYSAGQAGAAAMASQDALKQSQTARATGRSAFGESIQQAVTVTNVYVTGSIYGPAELDRALRANERRNPNGARRGLVPREAF